MYNDGSANHYKYFRLDGAQLYLCKRTVSTARTIKKEREKERERRGRGIGVRNENVKSISTVARVRKNVKYAQIEKYTHTHRNVANDMREQCA